MNDDILGPGISELADFVVRHTLRGECRCGSCCDRGDGADPAGHTIDVVFFPVALRESPSRDRFLKLSRSHPGAFGPCDPLDGNEHSFIELGGWLGDQGCALQYMALGKLLGVFDLFTPRAVMGDLIDHDMALKMAGVGLITVRISGPGGPPTTTPNLRPQGGDP